MGEVLWRRGILLNTLQILDCVESLLSLLIYDFLKCFVLVVYLLDNLLLDAHLLLDGVLHIRARCILVICLLEHIFKLINLLGSSLLQSLTSSAGGMIIEVAIIAESLVVITTVSGELIFVLTHANNPLWLLLWLVRGCFFDCFNHFTFNFHTLINQFINNIKRYLAFIN